MYFNNTLILIYNYKNFRGKDLKEPIQCLLTVHKKCILQRAIKYGGSNEKQLFLNTDADN